ncbi:hypothetical protein [Melissococcus plutonius]|uniref:Uncharacterized protein n=1 Tax=Melissococcus plutonius (strain ATCC 35311 / DSM 29964 / CIP 104052 / LMG 20360 / NCIMB 702443) TaxID=940190 RepID=F3Y8Y7_MELPT|nr:hypothetical protein [Melissococcus plutonius]AIM25600.1 hypothetical protein MEPL_c004260 [Melissococcus plutonius S1]KMT24663.1 hypothetical protein MEPL2_2c01730 [Melissococcus plutonius]KMT27376.1 hypothetical protein MEPL3_1c04550 [Melissococcus plutonius]KMT27549.1 hypothetical protein MEPL1_3c01660 [Melissococcus plutonius]KMT29323.1 hypothetical protein MEPL4_3c01650 [Melissococcus plutonius]
MKSDQESHKVIINKLTRIHHGRKMADISPEVQSTLKTLTGIFYVKCFGNSTMSYHKDTMTHLYISKITKFSTDYFPNQLINFSLYFKR